MSETYYSAHATRPIEELERRIQKAERKERRPFAWPYEVAAGWEDWTQPCTFCRGPGAQKYGCRDGNNWFLCLECRPLTKKELDRRRP